MSQKAQTGGGFPLLLLIHLGTWKILPFQEVKKKSSVFKVPFQPASSITNLSLVRKIQNQLLFFFWKINISIAQSIFLLKINV